MQRLVVLFILGLALPAVAAPAGPSKVGWIDLQRTLMDTKAGKAARSRLESEKTQKQKQVDDRKVKLQKQAEDLEKQRVVLKADAVAKRERELQEEYVQLQQLFVQLQQDLAKREATLTKEIFTQAASIISEIARRDGYTMIIEKNEGAVLWAEDANDITAEVNRRLDAGEGKPASKPAPAKQPPAKGK
jgi:outer membrane protein